MLWNAGSVRCEPSEALDELFLPATILICGLVGWRRLHGGEIIQV
jgi:hypothetical protein